MSIHILSGLSPDEHLWLMAINRGDWSSAEAIAEQIGSPDFDLADHSVEIYDSMQAMVGPTTWDKLHTDVRDWGHTYPLWATIATSLSFDLQGINLNMLRAFLKTEVWRERIYRRVYPDADIDDAYDEAEDEDSGL